LSASFALFSSGGPWALIRLENFNDNTLSISSLEGFMALSHVSSITASPTDEASFIAKKVLSSKNWSLLLQFLMLSQEINEPIRKLILA
jgi:hypothetical protein